MWTTPPSAGLAADPRQLGAARSYHRPVDGDGRRRWTARVVTYGLILVVAFSTVAQVEAWPVTSFELFSHRRTGESTVLELVAIGADGGRTVLRTHGPMMSASRHRYQELDRVDPARRRVEVLTWLTLAGVDRAGLRMVQLERVTRKLDPDGGPATVVSRTLVVRVPL